MSRFGSLVDQENLHARQAPGKGHVGGTRGARPVLGEISQNVTSRRQNLRGGKQPEKKGFTIFCDENAGVSQPRPVLPKSAAPALVDKENVAPAFPRVPTMFRAPAPILGSFKTVESFSDDSSDMEMDNTLDTSPCELESPGQSDWRVPPLGQHKPEAVDILTAPEYLKEIYKFLQNNEEKFMAKHNYMSKQTDISHSMRCILVDWLVEVGEEYKLQTQTLYLAVSYIDRFLSYMSVQRAKLQLVGAAAMFIASKYEEIYPPDVGEFCYITDDTYDKKQVLRMENLVLKVLGFDLSGPTAIEFLSQMCQLTNSEEKIQHLAMYVCELSLMHGDTFLKYPPSVVAAAGLVLARHALSRECNAAVTWPEDMASLTGYTCAGLSECVTELGGAWAAAEDSPHQAIREKYKTAKYRFVAEIPVPARH